MLIRVGALMAKEKGVRGNFLQTIINNAVPVALIVTVLMMFIPLPKMLIDLAMVMNFAIAIVILMVVISSKNASDFSTFPQVVLFTTLFGLAINISSTRLILTAQVTGSGSNINMEGQSSMVQSFANIATGNNIVVGFVIFLIIMIVQLIVITKGADRVSEVAARFTLDAMNPKMMDISQEENSMKITQEEAEAKRNKIRRDISFFSAMDGSTKFVSGNVKAGIFITVINLVGGFIIGMIKNNLSFTDALASYAKLTIGDGLLSQLPALIMSFATGLLVTASDTSENLSDKLKKEFTVSSTVYYIVGGTLIVVGIAFHNAASLVLLPFGGLFIYLGFRLNKSAKIDEIKRKEAEAAEKQKSSAGKSSGETQTVINVDPLSLELGYGLLSLVDKDKGAELLNRITNIRNETGTDLGLIVPPIRIRDNMSLDRDEYSFKIRGIEVGRSRLKMNSFMCMAPGHGIPKDKEIQGEKTKEPAFGNDAIWIPAERRIEAEKAGYFVIDPPTIIATHITEIIRQHAAEILTRQEVKSLIDHIKETNAVIVDEVLSGQNSFTYGQIEAVLRNLLREQVSIRNLVPILEAMADYAPYSKDIYQVTEKVREALGAQICLQYVDENERILHVVRLSEELERVVMEHANYPQGSAPFVSFDIPTGRRFISALNNSLTSVIQNNYLPIILTSQPIRYLVKSAISKEFPKAIVISGNEVLAAGNLINLEIIGEIHE